MKTNVINIEKYNYLKNDRRFAEADNKQLKIHLNNLLNHYSVKEIRYLLTKLNKTNKAV